MTVFAIMASLIVLMLVGIPIGVSMALVAIGTMWWAVGPDLLPVFIQRMHVGMTSYTLLAIPFFIIAGNLMNTGGMTVRIFALAQLLVGRVRGGLAHVNVLASMLFAGMSGSAVADAAGLGLVEVKAMREAGYEPRYAATITAVSSTIGPIIPPSIPFLVYASLANVSVGGLFIAGILPGMLMGLMLMFVIAATARRRNLPVFERRTEPREALHIIMSALPAIVTPVFVVGGLLLGFVTPTEAAVVAAAYALFVGVFLYREIRLGDFKEILWVSGRQTVQVMFIMAAAAPFGWVLIQQQVPNAMIELLTTISSEPWVVLLMVNAVLLLLGMFIEGIAVMIITVPILLPTMIVLGVDPLHFGVLIVLNLMIGLVTPPVGLCLFAVSEVSGVRLVDICREIWPYIIALMAVLLLITFWSAPSMWLPGLAGVTR